MIGYRFVAALWLFSATYACAENEFPLKLRDAEARALSTSNQLKSYVSDQMAAEEQANAQFANLFPKLSLQGNYTYYGNIPTISFGALNIPFGTNSTYSVGPQITYALWDTFSGRRSYQAASLLASARAEDHKNARLQLLASVRSAYVQVQLGLEELQLIYDTLKLSRAQKEDVDTRYRAGAAATLDVVTADKAVGGYEIQFRQQQADLASDLQTLFTLIGYPRGADISRPGPADVENVTLILRLDPLDRSLAEQGEAAISPPGDDHPQVRSLELQAQSSHRSAESQSAKLFPQLQLSGGVSYLLPNIPNPPQYWQESAGVSLSIPLYLGDPTPSLAAEQRNQATAVEFREAQLKDDIYRDFTKAKNLLSSLSDQKKLAAQDVALAERAAKLYYNSYRAGKVNLIDVQNANVQALQSKVDAARIDAQILNQIILLKSLSGKEEGYLREGSSPPSNPLQEDSRG
jgi:outer membrane protein TolC